MQGGGGSHLRAHAGHPGQRRARRRPPAARPASWPARPRAAPPRPAAAARSAGAATPAPPPPRRRPAPRPRRRAPPRQQAPAPRAAAGSAGGAARRARRAPRAARGSQRARGPPRGRPARRALTVSAAGLAGSAARPCARAAPQGAWPCGVLQGGAGEAARSWDQTSVREAGAATPRKCGPDGRPATLTAWRAGGDRGWTWGVPSVTWAHGQRELDQAERAQAGHAPAGAPAKAPRRCWRAGRLPGCGAQGRPGPPSQRPATAVLLCCWHSTCCPVAQGRSPMQQRAPRPRLPCANSPVLRCRVWVAPARQSTSHRRSSYALRGSLVAQLQLVGAGDFAHPDPASCAEGRAMQLAWSHEWQRIGPLQSLCTHTSA
jgi:hypothetical protein